MLLNQLLNALVKWFDLSTLETPDASDAFGAKTDGGRAFAQTRLERRWACLERSRPLASAASASGFSVPVTIALSIARAETPPISLTTDANFKFAHSNTFCNRLITLARSLFSVVRCPG